MRRTAVLAVFLLVTSLSQIAWSSPALAAIAPQCDTGGAPTTTVYLPNITKTLGGPTGWVTPFIVQNVGFFATTLEVSFYRFSDGALIWCRKIPQVQPNRSFADVPNNDADLPDNTQFSVVVRSFGSEIVAVVNEQNGVGDRSEALAYDGLSAGAAKVALPYVAVTAAGWLSTVIVQNVGAAFASVTAAFTSLDGSRSATVTRTIGPGRSSFIDPRFEPSLAAGLEYSAIVTSTSAVAVVVNSHNDTADVAHPRAFAYNGFAVGGSVQTFLPLVARNASGIGSSRLVIQNAGTPTAQPTVDLARNSDGTHVLASSPSPLASGRVWSFEPSVADGEYGATVSSGQFASLDIVLSPTTAMAYVAGAASLSRIFLPNVTRTLGGPSGWTTPIVIQRPSDGPSSVALRWYSFRDGRFAQQQVVTGLFAGASVRVDPRTVAGLTDDTQYAVVVDAKGPVSAIVQEMNLGGGAGAMIYPGFNGINQPTSVPTVITVLPADVTVALGSTTSFTVAVIDQFANATSPSAWPVTWSVSPASLGTVDSSGSFTARGYGSGKVTAAAGAQSSSVTVSVASPPGSSALGVPAGYSHLDVPTVRGTFGAYVTKLLLTDVSIKTATDNASDCIGDCPAQPLVEYLNQLGGFAGMNGTYLCPPDYAACAGKVNSYDYAVYSSPLGYWLNEWALVSPSNSLVTVRGKTLHFYQHTYDYDRAPVDAAISNFPLLVQGGRIVDSSAIQTDYQRERGVKGSIGTNGTYVFLVLVSGATVDDSAYVVQALGETDAMNLDGGGTSAMFIDREYKVGPGRLLPNAVVITRP